MESCKELNWSFQLVRNLNILQLHFYAFWKECVIYKPFPYKRFTYIRTLHVHLFIYMCTYLFRCALIYLHGHLSIYLSTYLLYTHLLICIHNYLFAFALIYLQKYSLFFMRTYLFIFTISWLHVHCLVYLRTFFPISCIEIIFKMNVYGNWEGNLVVEEDVE